MAETLVTKTVGDGNGGTFTAYFVNDGTAYAPATFLWDYTNNQLVSWTAASPVSQSGTWNVGLSGGNNVVGQVKPAGRLYKACAASATTLMGATGAIGDVLDGVLIIPGTTSPGAVQIKDGTGTAITIFAGGASSVAGLVPFFVPLYAAATGAGWNVITNANVTAIGVGQFT